MRTTTFTILMLSLMHGCASDAECPDDYELDGTCVKKAPDAAQPGDGDGDGDGDASAGDGDAAAGDGDGDGDGDASAAACELEPEFEGGFQSPCTDAVNHSECTCEADYCAVMPGAEDGFCTLQDCADDPDKCPDGYTCFDLSMFGVDLSFCNPE